MEIKWRSEIAFLRAKFKKPPKRYKDLPGGAISAPSGKSFSYFPPEG
jgi:hypothetical protein